MKTNLLSKVQFFFLCVGLGEVDCMIKIFQYLGTPVCLFYGRILSSMDAGNQTWVLEFLLLGLSEDPEQQPLLFGLFLSMYLVSMLGNLLIILAVSSDSRLHTPMYFFLSHLSFSDICYSSTIVPQMLVNIQTASKAITYADCITQMYFSSVFLCLDNLLLTVMSLSFLMCYKCSSNHTSCIIAPCPLETHLFYLLIYFLYFKIYKWP